MNTLLHDNLAQAANQCPDHTAFRCGTKSITYAELNNASSRFAAALIELGVQPEELVGLRTTASINAAIAVYGILKAGAAYVPIDPLLPDDRTVSIVKKYEIQCLVATDAKSTTLVTLENTASSLKTIIGCVSSTDSDLKYVLWSDVESRQPCDAVRVEPNAPAYVISTSGSTGEPKGIVHTHASGQSYAALTVATYNLDQHDRIASLSPLHFDMATFGLLAGVLAQATVVLVPPAYTRLPASLSSLIDSERITIWYSVPFALIQVLERGVLEQRDCSTLRWVVFAGEVFPKQHLDRLRRQWSHAAFSNAYGPAETNVCTVFNIPSRIQQGDSYIDAQESCPIGQPWGNVKALILSEVGDVAEPGTTGELLICGPTTMRSYFAGTETSPDAFYFHGSDRFYRTGDLVQQTLTGDLIYVGRKDRQVKVRGHRLELEAIESEISAHPATEECAVINLLVTEINELCAVVTVSVIGSLSPKQIRDWLSNRIPTYAIPTKIVITDRLNRTSTGKIDRQSLTREMQRAGNAGGWAQNSTLSKQISKPEVTADVG